MIEQAFVYESFSLLWKVLEIAMFEPGICFHMRLTDTDLGSGMRIGLAKSFCSSQRIVY